MGANETKIMRAVEAGEPREACDLARAAGLSLRQAKVALARLAEEGKVRSTERAYGPFIKSVRWVVAS